ncbi:MBL fold metallo-hydrolase [Deinococcus arenicola]|uniref:MBL fold metallo-hydrolase n=1 Tax=Deinococcus arenicola TaxID=2994950 RepID=A0ABU4DQ47_9DEIO|nr:MBL fold metallo-hydrolase [Deinococcus sp. ZS9-10]MDV6374219.1 MBL fold metallo-hydrolase [Deinococcus sp. ZS9-10]
MKLSDDLLVLELTTDFGTGPTLLHPVLILDAEAGHTLVDTGIPGMEGAIEAALAEVGASLKDIKQIIITHHDLDHIGSLEAVVKASGAQVWALEREIPLIDGREWPQKRLRPEQVEAMLADEDVPQGRKDMLQRISKMPPIQVSVDRALHDGELLPLAGGVRVVATPGHTFGHASLYLEHSKTLITGDAMTSDTGTLHGPGVQATPDMAAAGQSVGRMAGLDAQTIVTYHGGVVDGDASGQLKRVAAEMKAG